MDQYKTYEYKPYTSNVGSPSEWRRAFHVRMGVDEAQRIADDKRLVPHEILGVGIHASSAEIKSAYRRLALACHPDRILVNDMGREDAEEQFKRLTAAYTLMTERQ